jgi:F0F1-type ATP synthase assembly protein I
MDFNKEPWLMPYIKDQITSIYEIYKNQKTDSTLSSKMQTWQSAVKISSALCGIAGVAIGAIVPAYLIVTIISTLLVDVLFR